MARKTVTLLYNTCVYVVKFRLPLIKALQEEGYHVVVIAPEDETTEVLRARGIDYRPITMSQYGMNPLHEFRSIREIRGILQDLRPMASLHYTIKPNTFGTMAAHQAGVPVLNNIAGAGRAFSSGNSVMRTLVVGLYRRALRRSHTVFFQNGDDMAVFSKAGLVRDAQCVRIPGSGVDLTRFTPTPLPTGPVRFLFVGRLLKEKGIAEFLEAAARMMAAGDPEKLRFDIVGEHEDDGSFISRADLDRLTAAPQVTYHGTVPPEQIDGLMKAASCVVLPSYYGEGVPRVLLEACASGRPIITTDNVGCRDVVEHGVNGWKVAPRDVTALAGAMEDFAAMSAPERTALAQAARHTAETQFDEKTVINAYLDRLALLGAVEKI
jgi:glycosyltransferase involved in cell wall biosynthesis